MRRPEVANREHLGPISSDKPTYGDQPAFNFVWANHSSRFGLIKAFHCVQRQTLLLTIKLKAEATENRRER